MLKKITKYNKFLVAATMAVLYYLNARYGIVIPLDPETVGAIWMAIGSFLVWLVPNTKEEEEE